MMFPSALREMRASYAFVERNIYLVKRYWTWEMVWMAYSIANSLSVSYIGMGMEQVGGEGVRLGAESRGLGGPLQVALQGLQESLVAVDQALELPPESGAPQLQSVARLHLPKPPTCRQVRPSSSRPRT